MGDEANIEEVGLEQGESVAPERYVYVCDRCGTKMIETNCKIVCMNCGNRLDCSDLSLYFD